MKRMKPERRCSKTLSPEPCFGAGNRVLRQDRRSYFGLGPEWSRE
jgi:hypothetical protein